MDGYTFEEGVAALVLMRAPKGVINQIERRHNRSQLHSELHRLLRFPSNRDLLKKSEIAKISTKFHDIPQTEPTKQESTAIEQKSDEIEQKSDEIEPKSNDDEPDTDETDPTEIILTKEDVRTHENTRLEDMPNDLCRTLWLKRQDVYREMQQAHMKMRAVPEGEEHNEERAKWRAEVLRLDAENDSYWKQIDAEIERFNAEKEKADEKADKDGQAGFNESTYRAYISKAIRKKQLSPEQFAELQHRVDAMLAAGEEMEPETIEKLKAIGVSV